MESATACARAGQSAGAGVSALPAAPREEARAAPLLWEVGSRVAASARSARRPPAAADRLGECPAGPGNLQSGPRRRAGRLGDPATRAGSGGRPRGARGPADWGGCLLENRM